MPHLRWINFVLKKVEEAAGVGNVIFVLANLTRVDLGECLFRFLPVNFNGLQFCPC